MITSNSTNKYFSHWTVALRPNETDIREFDDECSKTDWDIFAENYVLSNDFLREFADRLDPHYLIENENINYNIFCELVDNSYNFSEKINWKLSFLAWRVSNNSMIRTDVEDIISKDLIEFFGDWEWSIVTELFELSEEFLITHFVCNSRWEDLSEVKYLSNYIMDQFADKLNWDKISHFHDLNDDFLNKYRHKLDWNKIIERMGWNRKLESNE